jgi:ribosome-associated heat shock protein Hsp15
VPVHGRVRVVRVMALAARRGPAAEAAGLYEELEG